MQNSVNNNSNDKYYQAVYGEITSDGTLNTCSSNTNDENTGVHELIIKSNGTYELYYKTCQHEGKEEGKYTKKNDGSILLEEANVIVSNEASDGSIVVEDSTYKKVSKSQLYLIK